MDRYRGDLISDSTRRFLARPKRMLIGGEWVEAIDGGTLDVVDPASEAVFAAVPAGGAADIERAVAAARRAFEAGEWPRMRPVDRERLLLKFAELIEANARELAEIEALDNGKPVSMARTVDLALVVDFLRYMAGWATKIEGATMEVSAPLVRSREFFGPSGQCKCTPSTVTCVPCQSSVTRAARAGPSVMASVSADTIGQRANTIAP